MRRFQPQGFAAEPDRGDDSGESKLPCKVRALNGGVLHFPHPSNIFGFSDLRLSQVGFHCDICERNYQTHESWDSLRSEVPRIIQQKLRARTYPKSNG
jgi:hypothetical protein